MAQVHYYTPAGGTIKTKRIDTGKEYTFSGQGSFDTSQYQILSGQEFTSPQPILSGQEFISSQPTINVENNINPPKTPEPTDITDYTQSIQKELEKQRLELEKQYQTQLETIQKQLEESRKSQEQTIQKQESTIQQAELLTQPFRQDIEEKERERLKVEENYFANQSLVNELDSLLTEINTSNLRDQELIRTGVISRTTANKRKENATARIGVIEAVLNARNNQIGTALNFIDRTVNAITQDKQSRLSYLNTLISFYDQARNEQGQKIYQLEKDERDTINKQISLLEDDLAQAQKNADYIKELMISPETAKMIADAGVTLLDTPEVVNKKLADYTYRQEKIQIANQMEEQGYQFITAEIAKTKPADEVTIIEDSRGVKQYWWKKAEEGPTTIVTVNGRKLLINSQTGKTIKDLGYSESQDVKVLYTTFQPQIEEFIINEPSVEGKKTNWNILRGRWIQQGGSASQFDSIFKYYNPYTQKSSNEITNELLIEE